MRLSHVKEPHYRGRSKPRRRIYEETIECQAGADQRHRSSGSQPSASRLLRLLPKLKVPESVSAGMVTLLLDHGLDVESTMPDETCGGCTALWFAVGRGRNPTLIKLLIKRGAKPARAPGAGLYAAGWVRRYAHPRSADQGRRDRRRCRRNDAVSRVLNWRKFEAAKFLAMKGADVNSGSEERQDGAPPCS